LIWKPPGASVTTITRSYRIENSTADRRQDI
jgi:hypothetical protein